GGGPRPAYPPPCPRVPGYEIQQEPSRGAVGVVSKAKQFSKVLTPASAEELRAFRAEADAASHAGAVRGGSPDHGFGPSSRGSDGLRNLLRLRQRPARHRGPGRLVRPLCRLRPRRPRATAERVPRAR